MFFRWKRSKPNQPDDDVTKEDSTQAEGDSLDGSQGSEALQTLQRLQNPQQRYRMVYPLGEGGFAVVDACFDELLNRVVAVKSVRSENRLSSDVLQLVLNEARLISYLNHPGIVSLYDVFLESDGSVSYTMNAIEGETLVERVELLMQQQGSIPVTVAQQIVIRLCETLAYAHDRGVLHLDVKPANIMLGQYGEVFLMDWGAACLYDSSLYKRHLDSYGKGEDMSVYEGRDGKKMGTLPFMAPEQLLQPRHALTPAADVFAVGVLFYWMLAGELPYPATSPGDFWIAAQKEQYMPLEAVRGDIPARLAAICAKMMEYDIGKRYSNLHKVLRELQDLSEFGRSFELQTLAPGEVLLKEGEVGDYAFQILAGCVEVTTLVNGEKVVLATRTKGNVVGEMAVFTREPRNATVTAVQQTMVRRMGKGDILKELDKLDPWVTYTVHSLSQRVLDGKEPS